MSILYVKLAGSLSLGAQLACICKALDEHVVRKFTWVPKPRRSIGMCLQSSGWAFCK